jgi:Flp pilus assembly protein TadD
MPAALALGWLWRLSPLIAGVLGALAFLPALEAGFLNWDDDASFLANREFRGLGPAQLRWMVTTTLLGHWSPLTWLTWSANYVLGGLDPWGYHLGNLVLHAANVALFCLVARRLLAAGFQAPSASTAIAAGAVLAALLWGVHPLRAESVAWISERRDVLCALFYLLAVLAYLRGVDGGGAISRRWWGLSLAAFAAALAAKAIAMTLPVTLLLLDVYPLCRRALGVRALGLEKAPYAVVAAAAAVVALLARQQGGNITEYGTYGVEARVALAAYTFWFYPWKFAWPTNLSPMYELPAHVELRQPRFLVPLVAVILTTALLVALRRRWPAGLAAWASSAIVLAPVSGVVHSGSQLAADRYSYLSSFGFALLAGAALTWCLRRAAAGQSWRGPLAACASCIAVAGLWASAWVQTTSWKDSETLWRRAVHVDPACSICESNLGRVVAGPGRFAEAETHVRRAIALRPDRPGPHENLAVIMLAQGRHREAEEQFRQVAMIRPTHGASRNNLGVALANQGRHDAAEIEFREAARLSPRLVDAPANLGMLYAGQGRYEEAIPLLRRALALDPSRSSVQAALGRALRAQAIELVRQSDLAHAERRWREARRLSPDDPDQAATLRALAPALAAQLDR